MKLKKPGKILVFSLGGSLVVPESGIDVSFLKKIRKGFLSLLNLKEVKQIIIMVGGGKTSRDYMNAAKKIDNLERGEIDQLGIMSTKLNAELVKLFLKPKVYHKVLKNPKNLPKEEEIIIASGWKPGNSSDLNTILWALKAGVDTVYNLTDVDFVYDKDPDKFPDAKPLERVSWQEFKKIIGGKWEPGLSTPFGPVACQKAQKHNMRVVVLKGEDYKNLKKCIQGKDFKGTLIE